MIDPSAFKSYAEDVPVKSNGKVTLIDPAFPSPLSKFTASLNPAKWLTFWYFKDTSPT